MSVFFKLAASSFFMMWFITQPVFSAIEEEGNEARKMETMVMTKGINHLGLAVKNLDETVAFFTEILGWEAVGGKPDYPAVFVTDGDAFVTLWQVEKPETAVEFNRRQNVGLHHLAFTVDGLDKLHALHEKLLKAEAVTIEFAPELLGKGPSTHMMIREPSGNRLEFIVPAKYIQSAD